MIDLSPLWISLETALFATFLTFFGAIFAAWKLFSVRKGWRSLLDHLLTLPLVLPPTVVGFFLLVIFGRRSVIGHALESIGFSVIFSWPATVIAAVAISFPLLYRTASAAFEQVPGPLVEAARTLGASEFRILRTILLPLAWPGVLAGTVLSLARAMGEFGATLMLAGNIPGRTQTLPLAIFSAAESGNLTVAWIWVGLLVFVSLGLMQLLSHRWRTGPGSESLPSDALGTMGGTIQVVKYSNTHPQEILHINVHKQLGRTSLHFDGSTGEGAMGVLGASGAGKTATLRMVAGLLKPDKGRIALGERVLFDSTAGIDLPPAERRIGFVFQEYALFPQLTVEQNIGYGLHGRDRHSRAQRVAQLMEEMGVRELAGRRPPTLSGGQRQRVALARALATEPDALLLDEPFAALDPHLRRSTEEQLRRTLAGYRGAVLFVTHSMEEAYRFCSTLVVVDQGQILSSGDRQMLFRQPRRLAAARLTGCKNIAAAHRTEVGRVAVPAWQCSLEVAIGEDAELTHVGYRSHQFRFQQEAVGANVFDCWLLEQNEAPHEMTLYLHLHQPPKPDAKPHLQADLAREDWQRLLGEPQPWRIELVRERILGLQE